MQLFAYPRTFMGPARTSKTKGNSCVRATATKIKVRKNGDGSFLPIHKSLWARHAPATKKGKSCVGAAKLQKTEVRKNGDDSFFPMHKSLWVRHAPAPKRDKKKEEKTQMKKQLHAKSIQCSQAVTHPSTDWTQRCLTSVIGRELVCSAWYGPWLSRGVSFGLLQAHGSLLG